MTNFDPGPIADARLVDEGTRATLIFERDFHHAPARVWAALTDRTQLPKWAPFTADRDLTSEGDVVLAMLGGDQTETFSETILRVEPPSLLEFTWGGDRLVWELTPNGTGTRLTLRHTVGSREWGPKVAAGWHLCFLAMDRLIAGTPMPPVVGDAAKQFGWQDLHDRYAAAFGEE